MTSSNAVCEVETGERYTGEVYLLHIHDELIKSRAAASRVEKFELSLSSCCRYLLNSKSNRER